MLKGWRFLKDEKVQLTFKFRPQNSFADPKSALKQQPELFKQKLLYPHTNRNTEQEERGGEQEKEGEDATLHFKRVWN